MVNGSPGNLIDDNVSRTNGPDLFQDAASQSGGNTFIGNTFQTSSGIQ